MIVKKLNIYKYRIPLKGEFRISFSATSLVEGIIIELETEEGITGYGESSPASRILGTNNEISLAAIQTLAPMLIGKNLEPEDVRQILNTALNYNQDAKAGLETAFLDAWCKQKKQPLYKCLGGSRKEFITDMTIGIKSFEETIKDAREYVEEGFEYLKIKVGENPDKDVEKIRLLREALGYNIHLKVDANQGWSPKQALKAARKLEKYEIELIEQPMPYWLLEEHAWLRTQTEIPIALDESVHTARDAFKALSMKAADIINIKLMKAGGILESLRIANITEASSNKNMIGCMIETRIGITAAAHIVGVSRNIVHIDLDSDLSLKWDPAEGGAEHIGGGKRVLNNDPGLGVKVNKEKLEFVKSITETKGYSHL